MDNVTIKIGTEFTCEGGIWIVTTSSENDVWGCTSKRTNSFTCFTTAEILGYLNI